MSGLQIAGFQSAVVGVAGLEFLQIGSQSNPFEFAAREWDSTNALYFNRARFYDPSAAGGHRFLGADPAGDGYAYAGNSPANFVDPTGRDPVHSSTTPGAGLTWQQKCLLSGGCDTGVITGGDAGTAGSDEDWLGRCGFDVGLTIFAAIVSLIGLNFEGVTLPNMVTQMLGTWGPDLYGLFHGSGVVGFVIGLAQFLWDFFTQIFENIIKVLIQSFWDLLAATFNISTDFVPGALMVRLGLWMVSQYFAIGSLAAENCL